MTEETQNIFSLIPEHSAFTKKHLKQIKLNYIRLMESLFFLPEDNINTDLLLRDILW